MQIFADNCAKASVKGFFQAAMYLTRFSVKPYIEILVVRLNSFNWSASWPQRRCVFLWLLWFSHSTPFSHSIIGNRTKPTENECGLCSHWCYFRKPNPAIMNISATLCSHWFLLSRTSFSPDNSDVEIHGNNINTETHKAKQIPGFAKKQWQFRGI